MHGKQEEMVSGDPGLQKCDCGKSSVDRELSEMGGWNSDSRTKTSRER